MAEPLMQITTKVTRADEANHPYFYMPFDVPVGTTRIDVTLAYDKSAECVIDLGVFDPRDTGYPTNEGFRGWSGGARDHFFVATDDATPGYIHGHIQSGTWNVILGLYKLPEPGAEVRITIALDFTPRQLEPQPVHTRPVRTGSGWYRGDLHCHTFHSDAKGTPEILHAAARQAGLDFLAVADHNTISQRRYFNPASSPDLIFIRAMEITTAMGHANVFGLDEWIDFRMTKPADAQVLERLVHEHGGLFSINHDKPADPWRFDLPAADCQEVWQSTWLDRNWISLERWQQRLASGIRLPAIGGSDYHQPSQLRPEGPLVLARPTTVLWLDELSEDAVLAAMKAGRGYITESPTGPELVITVNGHPMGSTVASLQSVMFAVTGAKGDRLIWLDASGQLGSAPIDKDEWTLEVDTVFAQLFLRAEIVAEASRERLLAELSSVFQNGGPPSRYKDVNFFDQPIRRAIGNPIYITP